MMRGFASTVRMGMCASVVVALMSIGLVGLSTWGQVADLVVEQVRLSTKWSDEGGEAVVTALVANQGDASAEAIWVAFLLDNRDHVGETFVEFLEPGGTAEVEILLVDPPPGEHVVTVLVDPEGLVEESNDENNLAEIRFGTGPSYEEGWCCDNAEIFPTSEPECSERGGHFFATEEEAAEACLGMREGLSIPDLKGRNWLRHIGELVTIEGIFVRDPIPILVTDLDLVLVNTPVPDTEYIVLLGELAEEIDPSENGGGWLRVSGVPRVIEGDPGHLGEYVGVEVLSVELAYRPHVYVPTVVDMEIPKAPGACQRLPHLYAILFSGGVKPAANWSRYWNDLKFMYLTLVSSYGFAPGNIVVLYADGNGRDNQMPVHYTGTAASLQNVFTLLQGHATSHDTIFLFTTNHGDGFEKSPVDPYWASYCPQCVECWPGGGRLDTNGDEGSEPIFESNCWPRKLDLNKDGDWTDQISWDEELCGWGDTIYDDSFTTWLKNHSYHRLIIVMEQCFSGGLIRDMASGGTNRVIMSACGEYEPSRCIVRGPYHYLYDEFSFHFTCAIRGADPKGKTINADTNGDHWISMVEAFNYARKKDTAPETPWYEDSGDGIPHSGSMPNSGDGSLGANTFL